ncbi:hypothetical protein [Spiroplasma poulsonii]|uniref:hypothetical protein n=1 Tax=Spiroplasma poulsonii TaxID=2138 RepID=UPI001F4D2C33|nr:hypothetical protein [Spiroplasma poulsonii]UNF62199.1 hypothetical protein MNU24_01660 [Spiroplasma poulsonii]
MPFEIARHFSTPNDCLILVSVGDHDKNPRKQVIKNARILEGNIVAYYNPSWQHS